MNFKKWLMFSIILVIIIAFSAVLIVTKKNKKPVYTEAQKRFIEIANERLESLGYNFENKTFKYEEFDEFDKEAATREIPEYLKSVRKFCVISYNPKGKYTIGGVADVYIDMETANILHVYLAK